MKAQVALEAIKGQKTANEMAAEYGVHPTQIAQWKKQVLDELPQVFSQRREKAEEELPAENLHLMRLLDEEYTRTPFYGIRRMTAW